MLQNETNFLDILGSLGTAGIDAWAQQEVARIQQPSIRNIQATQAGLFSGIGGGGGGGMVLLVGAIIVGAVILSR